MAKIRISAVSYLNSKPFVYGLTHSDFRDQIDLSLDMPSLCAAKLKNNSVDIGLIPVAAIPEIKGANIVTDYCIAASGKVRTVVLVSEVPIGEIKKIVLDYQSRTSVRLVKVLAENYWKIHPEWIQGGTNYLSEDLHGTTAGVVIGDRVFEVENKFPYVYDLSEVWKAMTGLDFVFACWVANKPIPPDFTGEFSKVLEFGIEHIPDVIEEYRQLYPHYQLDNYFRENILYVFDDSKRKGMELFWKYNEKLEL